MKAGQKINMKYLMITSLFVSIIDANIFHQSHIFCKGIGRHDDHRHRNSDNYTLLFS